MVQQNIPDTQSSISTIIRDALCGGLMRPALLSVGAYLLTSNYNGKVKVNFESLAKMITGYALIIFPTVLQCLGNIFDIEPDKNPRTQKCKIASRVCYAVLAVALVSNAPKIIRLLTECYV
jgi:hypothetical protein